MILELAIGDAYGAGFEYVKRGFVERWNDLSGYRQHPGHGIKPGCYTDDTQMSLAIAEAILSGEDWTALNLAGRFVECFKRDPREGYAGRFYDFLCSVSDGEDFLKRMEPRSDKSGAAMRAPPIGIFPSVSEVIRRATVQARLTHDTTDGINAAVAAALMAHYFIYDLGSKDELGEFLARQVDGQWNVPWIGEVGQKGWMSVRAAITAIQGHDSMSAILKSAVDFAGDVDTVATLALGAAAHCSEVEQDLPQVLYDELENGAFGRDYLVQLDKRLFGG
jgi:ADP-ribosyl-[dinitrogen reductase] hydrolase